MIKDKITDSVLTIGCDFNSPKGGVAQVLKTYSTEVFETFHFIPTTIDGNMLKKSGYLLIAIISFWNYMLFKKIKIVHIHGSSYNSFWRKKIFIELSYLCRKKIIYHIHGGAFIEFASGKKNIIQKTISKVDLIITLSQSWKEYFENEFDCKRVEVIPNIINQPTVNKAKVDSKNEKVKFLFLGNISHNKGIFDLINLIISKKESFNNKFELLIGGDGEINQLNNLIRINELYNVVKFIGWISGEEKNTIFNQTDVFILPSYNEGVPISILEAMSYGIPIISTTVGGIPEIITNGENGFLITPGSQEEIYHSIQTLIQSEKLRISMGQNNIKKVKSHFPEEIAVQLNDIYINLL